MIRSKSAKRRLAKPTKLADGFLPSSAETLSRLEAENAELRCQVADLALEIQTLCYPMMPFERGEAEPPGYYLQAS